MTTNGEIEVQASIPEAALPYVGKLAVDIERTTHLTRAEAKELAEQLYIQARQTARTISQRGVRPRKVANIAGLFLSQVLFHEV